MTREIQSYPQCTEAMAADLDRLEMRLTNLHHEASAYKRQRDSFRTAARAVIAAGRPHPPQWNTNDQAEVSCLCPQCAAWDDLAELLKIP